MINHSCEPNAEAMIWDHLSRDRVLIFAIKDIKAGDEITYDYKLQFNNVESLLPCLCGSTKCSGIMGNSRGCTSQIKAHSHLQTALTSEH